MHIIAYFRENKQINIILCVVAGFFFIFMTKLVVFFIVLQREPSTTIPCITERNCYTNFEYNIYLFEGTNCWYWFPE